jgi:hypothetical protein
VRRALSVANMKAAVRPADILVADELTPNAAVARNSKGTVASYAPSIPPVSAVFRGLLGKIYKLSCAMSNAATKIAEVIFGNTACLAALTDWTELASSRRPTWASDSGAQSGT